MWSTYSSTTRLIHVCDLDLFHRKPRINSQLVAQQVAQQYPMPPPPKKERRERSERTDKERPNGEGERANGDGRPEGERPESVRPEAETPEKDKSDKEQPIKDKPDGEKEISPAVTKKPSSKKTRSVYVSRFHLSLGVSCDGIFLTCICLFPPRPKSDNHQSSPSDKHSIQSGKSTTKTNKNSHISRCVTLAPTLHVFGRTHGFTSMTTQHFFLEKLGQHKASGKPQMIHK